MDLIASSSHGMISITPVTMTLDTVTENLHEFGFVTPVHASSDMDAAPSRH